jgi:hypothetical protein
MKDEFLATLSHELRLLLTDLGMPDAVVYLPTLARGGVLQDIHTRLLD